MATAEELLKFNFQFSVFYSEPKSVISAQITNKVEARIGKLRSISEKLGESLFPVIKAATIKEVFLKFKSLNRNKALRPDSLDKRELRTLAHALSFRFHGHDAIFSNKEELGIALDLLERHWRDSYLFGLLNCYLATWEIRQHSSSDILVGFIYHKLNAYDGNRKTLKTLKSNIKYFDKQRGDLDLGYTLALLNSSISKAAAILGFPDSWFSYPYFTKVILAYLEKKQNRLSEIIDELFHAIELHSNNTKGSKANKLIVSKLIILCNTGPHEHLQDKVKSFAFKLVGDPGILSNWAPFQDATNVEKEILIEGRDTLNEWITRQFLSVFFDKCLNDERRKRFWLQYAKKINTFKVYGPKHTKMLLKSDTRIAEYVDGRFQTVSSNRDVSAFLFVIGNYKMIEFSDAGYAFYAYKSTSSHAPSFERNAYQSVDSFRNGGMPMLVYRNGYELNYFSDEGRLTHNDGDLKWEVVFNEWIKRKVGINV